MKLIGIGKKLPCDGIGTISTLEVAAEQKQEASPPHTVRCQDFCRSCSCSQRTTKKKNAHRRCTLRKKDYLLTPLHPSEPSPLIRNSAEDDSRLRTLFYAHPAECVARKLMQNLRKRFDPSTHHCWRKRQPPPGLIPHPFFLRYNAIQHFFRFPSLLL